MLHSLLESKVTQESRSFGSLGVAFGLHAAAFAAIFFASLLVIEKITPPPPSILEYPVPVDFRFQAPPQGEPTLPDGGGPREPIGGSPPVRPSRPSEPMQPVVVPEPTEAPILPPSDGPDMDLTDLGLKEIGIGGDGLDLPGTGGRGGPGDGEGPGGDGRGRGVPGGTGDGPLHIDATVSRPELVLKVQPGYPETARKAKLEGSVTLQAVIARDGTVVDVEVLRSTNRIFEGSAMDAVRQWRYRPAMQDGKAVTVYFTVEVRFILQ